ncbi:hypothetical protein Mapa_003332 [Marchantia paleacea]|nr:hypothetical protein Mapa_003332 [Marchantia paleacea]
MKNQNPFTLRVGQIMTGFGAGCGVGVGVGYPIAVGSIPVLGDVMRPLTSAGSQAFGGVSYRAFALLKKLGIKNLKAGIGCGIGIGHGFGAGLALKPGVVQQLTHTVQEKLTGLMSEIQKKLPSPQAEIQSTSGTMQASNIPDDVVVPNKLAEAAPVQVAPGPAMATGYIPSELSPPSVTTQAVDSNPQGNTTEEDLRQENQILRTLLRHQELLEDLREENSTLRHILNEQIDLQAGGNRVDVQSKISAGRKYRGDPMCTTSRSYADNSCRNCFDCRRQSRRRRRL